MCSYPSDDDGAKMAAPKRYSAKTAAPKRWRQNDGAQTAAPKRPRPTILGIKRRMKILDYTAFLIAN